MYKKILIISVLFFSFQIAFAQSSMSWLESFFERFQNIIRTQVSLEYQETVYNLVIPKIVQVYIGSFLKFKQEEMIRENEKNIKESSICNQDSNEYSYPECNNTINEAKTKDMRIKIFPENISNKSTANQDYLSKLFDQGNNSNSAINSNSNNSGKFANKNNEANIAEYQNNFIPTTQNEFNSIPTPTGADRAISLINNDNDEMGVPKIGGQALPPPSTLNGKNKGYSDFNNSDIPPQCAWPKAVNNTGSCGSRTDVTERLKQDLQLACKILGKPVPVKSLKRDPSCNAKLKGAAKNSEHLDGTGFDLGWYELAPEEQKAIFGHFKLRGYRHGCYGTGIGNHVHLGFREINNYYLGACPKTLIEAVKSVVYSSS